MLKNLLFALLLAYCLTGCNRNDYPQTYTDATGTYVKLKGNNYHRRGDRLTSKGYRVYKMKFVKGFETDPAQYVVK